MLLLDQLSKEVFFARSVSLGRFARLRPVVARRSRFARRDAQLLYSLLLASAAAAAVLLTRDGGPLASPGSAIALGTALGGAAGNLTDMVRHRAVIDFIELGWWPVFNVADVAIVTGLGSAFLFGMLH